MSRVILSPLAEEDLTEIWTYIAKDSPQEADRFLSLLYDKCQLLASAPRLGTERPDLAPGIRGFPVGSHVIFYRKTKRGVEIARVLRGRRDIPSMFH